MTNYRPFAVLTNNRQTKQDSIYDRDGIGTTSFETERQCMERVGYGYVLIINSFICRLSLAIVVTLLVVGCSSTPKIPEAAKAPKKSEAEKRVDAWKELIATKQSAPESYKLTLVNDFINRLNFVDDIDHWKKEDYWATPLETIKTDGGDCEDFVIAKYFTLKYLQVPEERMRITYVKALSINKAHMVLSYFLTPESDPLVLDNLDREIKLSSQRKDLLPVYSFNAEGLWLAHQRGQGQYVGDSSKISLWQKLLEKMQVEPTPVPGKRESVSLH